MAVLRLGWIEHLETLLCTALEERTDVFRAARPRHTASRRCGVLAAPLGLPQRLALLPRRQPLLLRAAPAAAALGRRLSLALSLGRAVRRQQQPEGPRQHHRAAEAEYLTVHWAPPCVNELGAVSRRCQPGVSGTPVRL